MAEKKSTKKKSDDCEECKKYPKTAKNPVPCPCKEQDKPRVLIDGYGDKPLAKLQNAIFIAMSKHKKAEIIVQSENELADDKKAYFKGVKFIVGPAADIRDAFIMENPDAWIYRTNTFLSTKTIIEYRLK